MRPWREIRDQIDLRLEEACLPLDTYIRAVLISSSDTSIEISVEEDKAGREPVVIVITGR